MVLAAAGNLGPDDLAFPASLPEVAAVSALGLDGHVLAACCARREVDFFAPGEDVPAVGPDGRVRLLGSSPATVIEAGMIALRRRWPRGEGEIVRPSASGGTHA